MVGGWFLVAFFFAFTFGSFFHSWGFWWCIGGFSAKNSVPSVSFDPQVDEN